MTPRHRDVANLVAEGCSNQEIAHRLRIALSTVKSHLESIYVREGVRNRVELALRIRNTTYLERAIW